MKILILGATGRTGKQFAQLAAASNHQVSAIVRNKGKASLADVNYVEGSLADETLLNELMTGIDAVVVALNINRTSDNPFAKIVSPLTLISDSVKTLIPVMEQHGVKRLITVSASGVGDSWNNMPLVARLLIRNSNIWRAYEDHDRQEQVVRHSQLDWTIVRPVMLTEKDQDTYTAVIGNPRGGSISRKGVAKFILDTLGSGKYIRECVTLSR